MKCETAICSPTRTASSGESSSEVSGIGTPARNATPSATAWAMKKMPKKTSRSTTVGKVELRFGAGAPPGVSPGVDGAERGCVVVCGSCRCWAGAPCSVFAIVGNFRVKIVQVAGKSKRFTQFAGAPVGRRMQAGTHPARRRAPAAGAAGRTGLAGRKAGRNRGLSMDRNAGRGSPRKGSEKVPTRAPKSPRWQAPQKSRMEGPGKVPAEGWRGGLPGRPELADDFQRIRSGMRLIFAAR